MANWLGLYIICCWPGGTEPGCCMGWFCWFGGGAALLKFEGGAVLEYCPGAYIVADWLPCFYWRESWSWPGRWGAAIGSGTDATGGSRAGGGL
jgi:hypothetical protein